MARSLNVRGLTAPMKRALTEMLTVVNDQYQRETGNPIRFRITSARRTMSEQAALYRRQGKQGLAAPPGRSKHQFGRAVDIVFFAPYQTTLAAKAWKALGGRWGGDFRVPDIVHFEDPWPL